MEPQKQLIHKKVGSAFFGLWQNCKPVYLNSCSEEIFFFHLKEKMKQFENNKEDLQLIPQARNFVYIYYRIPTSVGIINNEYYDAFIYRFQIYNLVQSLKQSQELDAIVIHILHKRELKHKDFILFAQDHRINKAQSQMEIQI